MRDFHQRRRDGSAGRAGGGTAAAFTGLLDSGAP